LDVPQRGREDSLDGLHFHSFEDVLPLPIESFTLYVDKADNFGNTAVTCAAVRIIKSAPHSETERMYIHIVRTLVAHGATPLAAKVHQLFENGVLENNLRERSLQVLEYFHKVEKERWNRRLTPPSYQACSDFTDSVNIAVLGRVNVGKSSWVNASRGLQQPAYEGYQEVGASHRAEVGAGQTTLGDPKPFAIPTPGRSDSSTSLRLWDVPGFGTREVPLELYRSRYGIRYFNAVVLMFNGSFPYEVEPVVLELVEQKVPCALVLSKIDLEREGLVEDLIKQTEKAVRELFPGCTHEQLPLFHISSKCPNEFDFEALQLWINGIRRV